jgi:hypothetical protein
MSSEIVFYRAPDGDRHIEVHFLTEDFWMSQRALAELFAVGVPAINKHLSSIFETGELDPTATVSILEIVQREGEREVRREIEHYSLDAIIAVGYRVNSYEATQFRIWATRTLKEFVIKGFVLDDERLKQGQRFGKDYFDELLERIREIRASERRFHQKITDIYALSADYDKEAPITREFFAMVQNKLHWAISGMTAAEIIHEQADASKPHMGLLTWKAAPDGKIMKSDVRVAKNYLDEDKISELNRIVSAYLDLAENRAQRQQLMKMADWAGFLDRFLALSDYEILQDKGRISHEVARLKAEAEYDAFRVVQDREFSSDFDKEVERIKGELGDGNDED